MLKHLAAAMLSFFLWAALPNAADAGGDGSDRIRYDSKCLIIDGKDTFLYSGALHYFRCPKPLWADRLQRMRDAGMNSVETYVPWDWHEQQPPSDVNDFSKIDMTDLQDFLDLAVNKFGFYVILRPGPYICAEWDGGGYPQWLLNFKPAGYKGEWFRSDDPTYLAWSKHWYTAVAKTAAPFQITHRTGRGGVILWQIENEYNYAERPVEMKLHQLQTLAHDSRDLGIDVPLITCMTNDELFRTDDYLLKNVIECRNSYPRFDPKAEANDIDLLDTYQPEKPRMMTELQGGWFSDVGGKLSDQQGYTPEHIRHVTLLAWAHGYTGTNYYMMYGGTNFGDWGAADRNASYDYAAPIREWGGEGPRYFAVKGMGEFLTDHGASLVRSEPVAISTDAPSTDVLSTVLRKAADGSLYLFVINNQEHDRATGQLNVSAKDDAPLKLSVKYDLAPYDARIFYLPPGETDASKGEWLPEQAPAPERPTNIPAGIEITRALKKVDAGPPEDSWHDLPQGASEEDAGILDRRYVYYRSDSLTGPADQSGVFSAEIAGQDSLIASLNGTRLPQGHHGSRAFALLPNGASGQLLVLYENGGRDNGGNDARCGLHSPTVAYGGLAPKYLSGWKLKLEEGDPIPDTVATVADSTWELSRVGGWPYPVLRGDTGVFRAHAVLSASELKGASWRLSPGRPMGERQYYVNGIKIAHAGREHPDVTAALHEGDNVIAIVEHALRDDAGIDGDLQLDPSVNPVPVKSSWQISGQSEALAGKWWDPSLDDSGWDQVSVSADADQAAPAAQPINPVWYRMNVALPATDPHVWVPWKLHLEAAGNGFLYLNGHPLGRWWEVGPQTDFYLPECWLNFGPGSKNVITVCLRPTTSAAVVRKAEVSPYADFAEAR